MMHPVARAQIRSARMSHGLSLRELGRRTGVTASLLSQIETGKSDPSVSTLSALVSELGLSLDALLRSEREALDDRPVPLNGNPYRENILNGSTNGSATTGSILNGSTTSSSAIDSTGNDGTGPGGSSHGNGLINGTGGGNGADGAVHNLITNRSASPVIRPPERQTLDLDSGVVWERLTRGPSDVMDALLVTYGAGATSSSSGKLLRHSGIEHAYLISGELVLQLGFETYYLRAGDSLEFDAATPHVYCNQSGVPARGLWFVLGRDEPAAQPGHQPGQHQPGPQGAGSHRLDLADAGSQPILSAVDFLQAFSRE